MVPTFTGRSMTLSLATGQSAACLQLQKSLVHEQPELTACMELYNCKILQQ